MRKRLAGYRLSVTKSGFTMVEILVATVILVITMAAIYLSFKGGVASWTKGTARMEIYLNARTALDMMSREIEAAMLTTSSLYAIDFIYSTADADSSGGALRFAAVRDNSGSWDLTEIAYKYDSSGKEIERAVDVQYNFPANKSQSSLTFQPLVSNVNSLTFALWDGSSWLSSWDSRTAAEGGDIVATRDSLPQEVKITITAQDALQQETVETFSTIVYLPNGG